MNKFQSSISALRRTLLHLRKRATRFEDQCDLNYALQEIKTLEENLNKELESTTKTAPASLWAGSVDSWKKPLPERETLIDPNVTPEQIKEAVNSDTKLRRDFSPENIRKILSSDSIEQKQERMRRIGILNENNELGSRYKDWNKKNNSLETIMGGGVNFAYTHLWEWKNLTPKPKYVCSHCDSVVNENDPERLAPCPNTRGGACMIDSMWPDMCAYRRKGCIVKHIGYCRRCKDDKPAHRFGRCQDVPSSEHDWRNILTTDSLQNIMLRLDVDVDVITKILNVAAELAEISIYPDEVDWDAMGGIALYFTGLLDPGRRVWISCLNGSEYTTVTFFLNGQLRSSQKLTSVRKIKMFLEIE